MGSRRVLLLWLLAAAGATLLLVGVLLWDYSTRARWGIFLVGDPRIGEQLFDRKGCSHCHALNGYGGHLAPDLGFQLSPQKSLNDLVVAMWNHAPAMWARMRTERLPYPPFDYREMAHLFAFLYIVRYVDEPGNASRGKDLFREKGCIQCHAVYGVGGSVGPDLSQVAGVDTPLRWTQALWNHAPAMGYWLEKLRLAWPKFENREMNDLAAYIRQIAPAPRAEDRIFPADPGRGWKLFQRKSCIVCHAVNGEGGAVGPPLDRGTLTFINFGELAGSLWNHSPNMWQQMKTRNIPPPIFEGNELADLVAFLQGLGYLEPIGSAQEGQKLFANKSCGQCHGSHAEGTERGPALRKNGRTFTYVTLATALWKHGPKMYQRAKEQSIPWPTLAEGNLAPLLGYLNTSPPGEQR